MQKNYIQYLWSYAISICMGLQSAANLRMLRLNLFYFRFFLSCIIVRLHQKHRPFSNSLSFLFSVKKKKCCLLFFPKHHCERGLWTACFLTHSNTTMWYHTKSRKILNLLRTQYLSVPFMASDWRKTIAFSTLWVQWPNTTWTDPERCISAS